MLGGNGLIGRNLIKTARLRGIETYQINRHTRSVRQNHIDINLDLIKDVIDKFKPDFLVDAIGLKSMFYKELNINELILNNVRRYYEQLLSIVNSCNMTFYFISSGGAIYKKNTHFDANELSKPQPTTPYGIANLEIENIVKQKEKHIIIRGANIFGDFKRNQERQGLVTESFFSALENRTLFIDSLQTTRDYIYIDDFINILLGIMKTKCSNEIINVGSGKGVKTSAILDMIETLVKISGYKLKLEVVLDNVAPTKIILDISKMENMLPGYQFTNLKIALSENWRDILKEKL